MKLCHDVGNVAQKRANAPGISFPNKFISFSGKSITSLFSLKCGRILARLAKALQQP